MIPVNDWWNANGYQPEWPQQPYGGDQGIMAGEPDPNATLPQFGGYGGRPYDPNAPQMGYGGAPGPGNVEYAHLYNPDGTLKNKSPYAAGPQAGGSGDPNAFREAWFNSPYPKTVDGLKQFVAANPQFGAQITGSKGSKVIIGGQAFQAVRSAGLGGGIGPAWDPLGPEGGGGQQGAGGLAAGYMTAPYTGQFKLPTQEDLFAMPGFQSGLTASNQGVERSAFARGTGLTGGTLKALQQNSVDYANQKYGDLVNQQMGAFGINRDIFYRNQDAPFSKYLSLSQLGKPT